MPIGVALTTPSAAAIAARPSVVGDDAAGTVAGVHLLGELLRPLGLDVDDVEAADAEHQQRMGDRDAGAAGAELDDAAARRIGEVALERHLEPAPVGVVSAPATVAEPDGVDGAERFGVRTTVRRAAGSPPACTDG